MNNEFKKINNNELIDLLNTNQYEQSQIKYKILEKKVLILILLVALINVGVVIAISFINLSYLSISLRILTTFAIDTFSIVFSVISACKIVGKEEILALLKKVKSILNTNYKKELLSLKVENSFIRKSIKKLESETAMQKYSEESEQYSSKVQNELKYLRQVRSILVDFQNNYNRSYNFDDDEIAEQVSEEIQKVKRR